MKILKSNLLPALESACKIAGRKNSLPILNSVMLAAAGNRLSISATDLEQRIVEHVECEGEIGALCLNSKRIFDAIKFSGDEIEIGTKGNNRVFCKSSNLFELASLNPDEFPPIKPESKLKQIGVNCADLAACIDAVKHAASVDETRQVICSVYISGSAEHLTALATCGKLIAERNIKSISAEFETFIPSNVIDGVSAALKKKGASLWLSENEVKVTHDSGEISARLVEGQFPIFGARAVQKDIKNDFCELGTDELLSHIKASLFTSNDQFKFVDLEFKDKSLLIQSNQNESSYEASIDGKFKPLKMRFDQSILIKALSSLDSDTVKIKIQSSEPRNATMFIGKDVSVVACMLRQQ